MLKEILTAALAIVAAWLLIALLPSVCFGWLPLSVPVSSPVIARLDPARGSD